MKDATNGIDTIDITFTDGHFCEVARNSVYAMVYRGGILWTPDNQRSEPHDFYRKAMLRFHTGAMHTDWLRPASAGLVYNDPGGAHGWKASPWEPRRTRHSCTPPTRTTADAQYYYAR